MVALFMLSLPGLALTIVMFTTRNMMLGFPSAIFWGIFGGYAYMQSAEAWDWQYILFFASMGMVIFSLFAAFALRRKDLAGPDGDKGKFFDEVVAGRRKKKAKTGQIVEKRDWGDIDSLGMYDLGEADKKRLPGENPKAVEARERVQDRAKKRKTKVRWGEFG